MKRSIVITIMLSCYLTMFSCEDEGLEAVPTTALKIVHAAVNVGDLEVKELKGSISNRITSPLRYSQNNRYTFTANATVDLLVLQAEDTTATVLQESLALGAAGGIYSLFLVGDSSRTEALLIEDVFQNYPDSTFGVRFMNLSPDSEPVSIQVIATDTTGVSSNLAFKGNSDFIPFSATSEAGSYIFQFLDASGNLISAESINPISNRLVGKNITLALIGLADDGGDGSLDVARRIDHFND